MRARPALALLVLLGTAATLAAGDEPRAALPQPSGPFAIVLGVAQDGGYPQAGTKESPAWDDPALRRLVACLGLVDPAAGMRFLVEATPDLPRQLYHLDRVAPVAGSPGLDGILLTHAHVGHYAGLIHLGREAMGARGVPLFVMPKMAAFLRGNGPWELLVRLGNVELRPLAAGQPMRLSPGLEVTPLLVPHRDEYSETVAFRIAGPRRTLLWLPDIDKWERWDEAGGRLETVLAGVDVAYLDATFFADGEVPGRPMAEIPHPFVRETIARLRTLPAGERAKVRFVHLNRTNPLLQPGGAAHAEVTAAGMRVAEEGERVEL